MTLKPRRALRAYPVSPHRYNGHSKFSLLDTVSDVVASADFVVSWPCLRFRPSRPHIECSNAPATLASPRRALGALPTCWAARGAAYRARTALASCGACRAIWLPDQGMGRAFCRTSDHSMYPTAPSGGDHCSTRCIHVCSIAFELSIASPSSRRRLRAMGEC